MRVLLSVVVGGLLLCGGPGSAAGRRAVRPQRRERYIVMLRPGATTAAVAQRHAAAGRALQRYSRAFEGFAAEMTPDEVRALKRDRRVLLVEEDLLRYPCAQTLPYGIDRVEADQNTFAKIDGIDERVDVDIAIIDTGIDLDHPDLNVFFNQSFVAGVPNGDDQEGHGTHVAGTAAALDNDFGVVGVAPGARLWALRVFGAPGSGAWDSDIIAAIDFVTAHADEIEVVNMSLGGPGKSVAMRSAIQASVAMGVVYVVAAGNDGEDVYGWDGVFGTWDDYTPASYPEVMTVSATTETDGIPGGLGPFALPPTPWLDDTFAQFTNYSSSVILDPVNPVYSPGAAIDLAAPGVHVLSTIPDDTYDYFNWSGTSMSSPHVAGAVALYIAEHGRATNAAEVAAIRQALIDLGEDQSLWIPWYDPLDVDLNHERLLNVSSGPHPPAAKSLVVTAGINQQILLTWQWVIITVTITDSETGLPVPFPDVYVEIVSPTGRKRAYVPGKQATGIAQVRFRPRSKRDGYGGYRVRVTASKAGYEDGEGETLFYVGRGAIKR